MKINFFFVLLAFPYFINAQNQNLRKAILKSDFIISFNHYKMDTLWINDFTSKVYINLDSIDEDNSWIYKNNLDSSPKKLVPFEFDVHALIYSENAPLLERQLHKKFLKLQLNTVNPRKEFFNVSLNDVKSAYNELGITAKWTMTAEAKQYRESLAIAEAI